MTKEQLIEFYKGTDYLNEIRKGLPPRPSEWHLPIYLKQLFESNPDFLEDLPSKLSDGKLEISIPKSDSVHLRSTLLHESLFSFYKAFYNYLAARRLYNGGIEHWIEITNYYSKLFLARAINTILGHQLYSVGQTQGYFNPEILEAVNPKGYEKYKNGGQRISYTVELDIDTVSQSGRIFFSKKPVSTHQDIWKTYKGLNVEKLGLTRLDNFDTESWDLIDERNRENYSFDGYKQLDFNLYPESFPGYFNRNEIIKTAFIIYDEMTGEVLMSFQELFHLYKVLGVNDLPIELAKFEHMINYMLEDSEVKDKLITLCNAGFPLQNDYLHELSAYYNS